MLGLDLNPFRSKSRRDQNQNGGRSIWCVDNSNKRALEVEESIGILDKLRDERVSMIAARFPYQDGAVVLSEKLKCQADNYQDNCLNVSDVNTV